MKRTVLNRKSRASRCQTDPRHLVSPVGNGTTRLRARESESGTEWWRGLIVCVFLGSGMVSSEGHARWRLRIDSAADRYEAAKLRVGEAAVQRLRLPSPDGHFAHSQALREEMLALKDYSD